MPFPRNGGISAQPLVVLLQFYFPVAIKTRAFFISSFFKIPFCAALVLGRCIKATIASLL